MRCISLLFYVLPFFCILAEERTLPPSGAPAAKRPGITASPQHEFLLPRENPLGLQEYVQTVVLTYPDEQAEKNAALSIAALPFGKKLAVSCRWDDNNPAHIQMHDLMVRYGFRGTFYLNDLRRPLKNVSRGKFLEKLTSGACTVGVHGMKHSNLAKLSDPDEIFRELGACRAQLEAMTDVPVTAHAFAYGAYRKKGDDRTGRLIAASYARCGLLHESYAGFPTPAQGLRPTDFSSESWILPGDRNTKFDTFVQQLKTRLGDTEALKTNPNLTIGIHTWQKGDDWKELEKCFATYAKRPDWWYCTAAEYGAYRYEFHHAKLERVSGTGGKAVWKIRRPVPAELGRKIPLFLECGKALSAEVDGRKAALHPGGVLELRHDPRWKLPARISLVSNPENKPDFLAETKIRGFSAGLVFVPEKGLLLLKLNNRTGTPLRELMLRARLPLACTPGVIRLPLPELPPGEQSIPIPLPLRKNVSLHRPFFWCELDFELAGEYSRLHAVCNR